MENPYLIAIIGLAGALIGVLGSIVTSYIQARITDKREKSKLIFNTAVENYNSMIQLVIHQNKKVKVDPLVSHIFYMDRVIDLVEKRELNLENIISIDKEHVEFTDYMMKKSSPEVNN